MGVEEEAKNCSFVSQMHSQSANICFRLHTLSMTLHMEIKLRLHALEDACLQKNYMYYQQLQFV